MQLWNKNMKIYSCEFLNYWFHNMVKFMIYCTMWCIDMCQVGEFLQIHSVKHCLILEMLVLSHLLDLLVLFLSPMFLYFCGVRSKPNINGNSAFNLSNTFFTNIYLENISKWQGDIEVVGGNEKLWKIFKLARKRFIILQFCVFFFSIKLRVWLKCLIRNLCRIGRVGCSSGNCTRGEYFTTIWRASSISSQTRERWSELKLTSWSWTDLFPKSLLNTDLIPIHWRRSNYAIYTSGLQGSRYNCAVLNFWRNFDKW